MRRILATIFMICTIAGCGNLSPRINPQLDQKINNQNGKIDEIKNNQNGIMSEINGLKQRAEIHDSTLKDVQQGMVNLQAAWNKNDNSGIQLFQGDGALMLVFGLVVVGMVIFHYRNQAIVNEKAANIMASEVARYNDPNLHENIFRAALHTDAETTVYHLITKHRTQETPASTR